MSIISAELMACIPNQHKYTRQASVMLEEKYGEVFAVEKYLGQDSMRGCYKVLAYSNEYPDILFEAEAAFDGSYISDEYVSSRVCSLAEGQIENNLKDIPGYILTKVIPVSQSIDSDNADMTMEEFMSLKTKNRFAVYMIYSPAIKDTDKVYKSLKNTFNGLECMSGNIQLYTTNEKTLRKIQEYLTEHAEPDYAFDQALESALQITIPFEQGEILLSEEEFGKMAGDKL